jgi:hypothetical protein
LSFADIDPHAPELHKRSLTLITKVSFIYLFFRA